MTAYAEKIEELALQIICPTCLAPRGIACRTTTDGRTCVTHSHRSYPVRAAYAAGEKTGKREEAQKHRPRTAASAPNFQRGSEAGCYG